jgi:hypothetical protein
MQNSANIRLKTWTLERYGLPNIADSEPLPDAQAIFACTDDGPAGNDHYCAADPGEAHSPWWKKGLGTML